MKILSIVSILIFATAINAQTVQTAINAAGCSTAVVGGLAKQLVDTMNRISPGLMSSLSGQNLISLSAAVQAVPWIQTNALNSIKRAVSQRGSTLTINSALRTVPQQLMLYKWYLAGKCGITAAAKPGASNHESGLAIDVNDNAGWKPYLESNSFQWYGSSDAVHFDYIGSGATSIVGTSVRAFQRLWNCNNPNDKISEDGIYGPATEARILSSPTNGFSISC